ncbi:MAG: hypothetical protein DRI61_07625 [Chloroflexi bacterium]|nr:MAG: hypothetical protein DRI61_07625 [Chloroflexota bacterium]
MVGNGVGEGISGGEVGVGVGRGDWKVHDSGVGKGDWNACNRDGRTAIPRYIKTIANAIPMIMLPLRVLLSMIRHLHSKE